MQGLALRALFLKTYLDDFLSNCLSNKVNQPNDNTLYACEVNLDFLVKFETDAQATSNGLGIATTKQMFECVNAENNRKELENLKHCEGLL